jgi:hypothetical protein
MSDSDLVPVEQIQSRILVLRSVRVLLDADLAALYGVPTKRLNEQVKRNARRFPEDFVFRLTAAETAEVVAKRGHLLSRSQIATLKRGHNVKYRPYAFTEFGAIQAANVVNTPAAEEMGIMVVRAFVQLRLMLVNHKALAAKLAELDQRVGANEADIVAIVEAIRQLTTPDAPTHGRRIGFQPGTP